MSISVMGWLFEYTLWVNRLEERLDFDSPKIARQISIERKLQQTLNLFRKY